MVLSLDDLSIEELKSMRTKILKHTPIYDFHRAAIAELIDRHIKSKQ